jgi:hypothetical protein
MYMVLPPLWFVVAFLALTNYYGNPLAGMIAFDFDLERCDL